jgi:hypothetical protein
MLVSITDVRKLKEIKKNDMELEGKEFHEIS